MAANFSVMAYRNTVELKLGHGPSALIQILTSDEACRMADKLQAAAAHVDAHASKIGKQELSGLAAIKRDMQQLATAMQAMGDKVARLEALANTHSVNVADHALGGLPAAQPGDEILWLESDSDVRLRPAGASDPSTPIAVLRRMDPRLKAEDDAETDIRETRCRPGPMRWALSPTAYSVLSPLANELDDLRARIAGQDPRP